MAKIALIGAGSTIFAKNLMGDILSFPELSHSTISLHDIDPARLRTSEIVAHKIAQTLGVHPIIQATTDRRAALDGADYAIGMFQVGGYRPATLVDFAIPSEFGLRQTIAKELSQELGNGRWVNNRIFGQRATQALAIEKAYSKKQLQIAAISGAVVLAAMLVYLAASAVRKNSKAAIATIGTGVLGGIAGLLSLSPWP